MRAPKTLTTWAFGVLTIGTMAAAAIVAETTSAPARAQLSGNAGLSPAQLSRVQRMQGQFVYESGVPRTVLWGAVEAGTSGLNPAQVRRTRAQLEQSLTPPPRIELTLEAGDADTPGLAIREGRVSASASLNGQARALPLKGARADAELVQLSHQLQGTTLLRVIEGKDLRQERRFSLSADGNTLTCEIRVSGAALGRPLTTSAVYRRI